MLIESDKILAVFNKVRIIREILARCPFPQGIVLNPLDVHWAVQDAYGLRVAMFEVLFDGEYFVGKVERYIDGTARVLVRAGMADEMTRFVTVKELSHLMIDEKDDWSTLGVNTIKSLLVEWELAAKNGDGDIDPSIPLQSEYLAEIGATELLYPFDYREVDMVKIDKGETSIERIGFEHGIPAFAVDQALRHHHVFAEVWATIKAVTA